MPSPETQRHHCQGLLLPAAFLTRFLKKWVLRSERGREVPELREQDRNLAWWSLHPKCADTEQTKAVLWEVLP